LGSRGHGGTGTAEATAFSLSLHPDKTRLIAFGRHAAQNCKKLGLAKPETFTFLGFVFICGISRRGDFRLRRKSRRDRMRTKLREIKEALRQRMHRPIPETGKWLGQIVAGYFAYHAVPTNSAAIAAFRYHVTILWHRRLCRRSPSGGLTAPCLRVDKKASNHVCARFGSAALNGNSSSLRAST
jgi:RNA-directed DNA polymerase